MQTGQMAQIFLSYSRNDGNEFVAEVQRELEARGYTTWRDVRNLHPDQDFTADIEAGIAESSHVVVCVTEDTKRNNSFVRREIQYALAIKKPVISLLCTKDVVPHIHVINNECLKYFEDKAKALDRLTEILNDPRLQNEPGDQSADPFRPYLEAALQSIVTGLQQRIIRQIDLRSKATPDAVDAPEHKPQTKPVDIFQLAMSGVKMGGDEEPEQAEEKTDFETFAEAFEYYHHRVLLMGEPGAGKTITLMAYAREAYAARLEDPTKPLPLFGLIPTWDVEKQPPIADWLAETYGLEKSAVQREVERGRALLLLDGLDELEPERPVDPKHPDGEKYDPRLRFIKVMPENNQILMTSRIADYEEMVLRGEKATLNGAITLQPLNERQMARYLADQPELWQLISSDEQLREITRTPLLMSLFAFIYQDMEVEERNRLIGLQDSLDLRDQIFLGYVEKRYKHESRKINAVLPFSLNDMMGILSTLATRNTWRTANVLDSKSFREFLSEDKISEFIEMAVRLHVLLPTSQGSFRFIHLLLRDVLAFNRSIRELSNINPEIRYDAAYTLGRIKDVRAVLPLIETLKDKEGIVRWHAVVALGELTDSRAVEALKATLKNENNFIRNKIEHSLAQIQAAQVTDQLISVLLNESNALIQRKLVVECLTELRRWTTIAQRAMEPAIFALRNEDATIRCTAAMVLGYVGNIQAIEPLALALEDADWHVRTAAAIALRDTGNEQIVGPLIMALQDADWHVRTAAAIALGGIGTDSNLPLGLESSWIQNRDIDMLPVYLERIGDNRAVEPLTNALKDEDWHVRAAAVAALAGIGYKATAKSLINLLRDEDWNIPPSDVEGLWWDTDNLKIFETFISALQDEHSSVRRSAVDGLNRISDIRAVEPLIACLSDQSQGVRQSAAEALGRISDRRAVEPLIAVLGDENENVCYSAVLALGKLGDDRAVEPLSKLLSDENRNIHWSAVASLQFRGNSIGSTFRDEEARMSAELSPETVDEPYIFRRLSIPQAIFFALRNIGTPEALAAIEEWRKQNPDEWDD